MPLCARVRAGPWKLTADGISAMCFSHTFRFPGTRRTTTVFSVPRGAPVPCVETRALPQCASSSSPRIRPIFSIHGSRLFHQGTSDRCSLTCCFVFCTFHECETRLSIEKRIVPKASDLFSFAAVHRKVHSILGCVMRDDIITVLLYIYIYVYFVRMFVNSSFNLLDI